MEEKQLTSKELEEQANALLAEADFEEIKLPKKAKKAAAAKKPDEEPAQAQTPAEKFPPLDEKLVASLPAAALLQGSVTSSAQPSPVGVSTVSSREAFRSSSRTTPFFPTFSRPASNWGLMRQTISPPSLKRSRAGIKTLVREINDTSTDAKSSTSSISAGVT